MERAVRFSWYFTIMAFLAGFMHAYAYLPEKALVMIDNGKELYISKDNFFFLGIAVFILVNLVVTLSGNSLHKRVSMTTSVGAEFPTRVKTWFFGLTVVFNIFILFSAIIISLINDPESYNLNLFGVILFIPIILLVAWIILGIYFVTKRSE